MLRDPKGSYNADFDQFSRFLRGSSSRYTACNSEAGGARQATPQHTTPQVQGTRPLAMVYAVKQGWQSIYDPEIALINGTIFEELNKPFEMSGCSRNNGCRGNNGGRQR